MVFGPRYRGLKAWDSSQRPARSRLGRGHGRVLGADRQTAPGDPIELSERGETETAKGKEGKQQKHPGFFHESPRMAFFKKKHQDGWWMEYTSFGEFRKKRIMPHPQRHWYLRIWVLDKLSNKLGDLTQGQKKAAFGKQMCNAQIGVQ